MDTAQLLLSKNAQVQTTQSALPWLIGGAVLIVLLVFAFRKER